MDIAVPPLPERYRVYRELGRGAQGVVLHAHDEVLHTDVALKVLRPELAGDDALVERMRREAVLTRRVVHPGICRVHDLVTTESATFLVMDYVDGESLGALLEKRSVAVDEVVRIVVAAAEAVSAAHAAGVVHRDLKPHNVLVTVDGKVVVVDFGVATAADMPKMTTMDAVVGTRAYIAPEIWLGAPATALADIFALGVVLYEALTGTVPYGDVDAAALTSAIPPSARKKEVPPWLDEIVLKAMAPLPRDRFQSMKTFATALATSDDTRPIEPWRAVVDDSRTEPEPRAPRRRSAVPIALGIGAFGIGAVAVVAVAVNAFSSPSAIATASAVDAGSTGAHLVPHATTTATTTTTIDAGVAPADAGAAVDAGIDGDGAVVTNDVKPAVHATTPGASLASKRRAAWSELARLRAAKKLIPRDAPALDVAIADVQRAKSERAVDDAVAAGNRAAASVVIDAGFLDRKLTRLNASWAALDGDAKERVGKALSRASSLIAQRKYEAANVALNDGFALIP